VIVDYFTKWTEVEVVAAITELSVREFAWKNIIWRFECPLILIADNGRQFDNSKFKDFLLRIKY